MTVLLQAVLRTLSQSTSPDRASVKAVQDSQGSRQAYARRDGPTSELGRLTGNEAQFIAKRDSFYRASAGAGGWPYVQIVAGRLASSTSRTIAASASRTFFFFMDYPDRTRLKLLGHVRQVDLTEAPDLAAALVDRDYGASIERGFIVEVEAFDWNCPQHITRRFTLAEIAPSIETLKARIAELEAEAARNR